VRLRTTLGEKERYFHHKGTKGAQRIRNRFSSLCAFFAFVVNSSEELRFFHHKGTKGAQRISGKFFFGKR